MNTKLPSNPEPRVMAPQKQKNPGVGPGLSFRRSSLFGFAKNNSPDQESLDIGSLPSRRANAWLDARLTRSRKERWYEDIKITPQMASALLRLNTDNRRINRSQVESNSDLMRRGQFRLTHQGIAICKEGILNDGQHRLTAIVETGISCMMHIAWGVDREEFKVNDTGGVRGTSDILSIMKVKNAAVVAALGLALWRMQSKDLKTTPKPETITDLIDTLGSDVHLAAEIGVSLSRVTTPTSGALAAFAILSTSRATAGELTNFWHALRTGENSGRLLPVRDALMSRNSKFSKSGGRDNNVLRAAAIILAWNAGPKGRKAIDYGWTDIHNLPQVTK